MASNARCLSFCFFFLVVSFSAQTQARESKFFSKFTHHHYQHVSRKTQENLESISLSPAQSPSLAPAPSPEPDATKSTDVIGEVKHVGAHVLGDKTFRDFVMSYPNDNHNGWTEKENGYETERQRKGQKMYLVHGKYYYGYVTGENAKENEKQRVGDEHVEDENSLPENRGNVNDYDPEKQEMGETKYYVNGKYYTGYVTKSENGDEKPGRMDQGKEKYFVNGKYYSGYVTGENRDINNQDYSRHEYGRQGTGGVNAVLPRQYDSMDEYDNEQEYMP